MVIAAISSGNYPDNEASTNRHLAYLRGLSELNNEVILYSLFSTQNNIVKKDYYGVNIRYCSSIPLRKGFLNNILVYIISLYNLYKYLIQIKIKNNKNIIINLLVENKYNIPIMLLVKLLSIRMIHERTEYPFINNKDNLLVKLSLQIYLKLILPNFDGLFVISDNLKNYYSKYTKNTICVCLITVECSRFNSQRLNNDNNFISYVGNMYGNKDGVNILIESFSKISTYFKDLKLQLIGDNTDSERMKNIYSIIRNSKIDNKIVFTGKLDRDLVVKKLYDSKVLCLARPNSPQAHGGFPTKLGEYLMTGLPVLVTDVGNISSYLTHNQDIYFAKPDSVDDFAEKLKYILFNYEAALEVGQRGKSTAEKLFSHKTQAKVILGLIKEVVND